MKHLILILFLVLLNAYLFAQAPDTLWTKTFGGSSYDYGFSVQQTSDGGYIIIGTTGSFGAGGSDIWLIKTDTNGDTLWTKTYGGSEDDRGHSVRQTSDGGYIITGMTSSFGSGSYDVWLIKTDSSGNTLWTKTFGDSQSNGGNSVQQTSDGGYIITGYIDSYGTGGSRDVLLIKTDTNGDTLWTKVFGGDNLWEDIGKSVQQTTDGGYVITGIINGDVSGMHSTGIADVWLIKTDTNGDTLWTKTFGVDSLGDSGNSVQQTKDGGYIITGFYGYLRSWRLPLIYPPDVWLIKTDAYGRTLWTKTFGGSSSYEEGKSVQQTTEGGYVIVGNGGAGGGDVWLIKTDANGDTLWTKTFGESGIEMVNSVQQTTEGGYVIVGTTEFYGAGNFDVWLIRLAPDVTAIDETPQAFINDYRLQQNYPNPFNPNTVIKYQIPELSFVTLKVYDVLGNELATLVNEEKTVGNYEVKFDGIGLPSGIYFYKLQAGNFIETKKMVLMK